MKYMFKKEYGAIVSTYNQMICLIEGEKSEVNFPIELILDMHKRTPGYVSKLAHVHPPGLDFLSDRDIKTLKTLAFTLYPYPIAMSVITPQPESLTSMDQVSSEYFVERTFTANLEPKEFWVAKGKGIRKLDINLIEITEVDPIGVLLVNNSYTIINSN